MIVNPNRDGSIEHMTVEKAISIPIKEISHLKLLLVTWYAFLRDEYGHLNKSEFSAHLKTPVIYDLNNDELEILFTASDEMLQKFRSHIEKKSTIDNTE